MIRTIDGVVIHNAIDSGLNFRAIVLVGPIDVVNDASEDNVVIHVGIQVDNMITRTKVRQTTNYVRDIVEENVVHDSI